MMYRMKSRQAGAIHTTRSQSTSVLLRHFYFGSINTSMSVMFLDRKKQTIFAFSLFAVLCLISELVPASAPALAFVSPLEWIASLALVMAGDLPTIQGLMHFLTLKEAGGAGQVIRLFEAGLLGAMFYLAVSVISQAARQASSLGHKLFQVTFTPIWLFLVTYKPFLENVQAYAAMTAWLEQLPGDVRRGVGFGILLLAVVIPLLAMLGTLAVETILNPERAYRKD